MFVVEDRGGSPSFAIDVNNLAKVLVSRILRLSLFVDRVITVFADQENAVDSQFACAERQRLLDGLGMLHAGITFQTFSAQVVLTNLFDVQRHDVHVRTMVFPFPAVPFQEAIDDVLCV